MPMPPPRETQASEQAHGLDEKLGLRLVREKHITESQLKTAMDFQRAVGGSFDQVLVRLGFIDVAVLRKITAGGAAAPPEPSPPPPPVSVEAEIDDDEADEEPPKEPAAPRSRPPADTHTHMILESLLRILVRKGIITRQEIKEELARM